MYRNNITFIKEQNEGVNELSDDENEMEEENWGNLQGEVISLTLEQNNYGLGLSLAGGLHFTYGLITTYNLHCRPQRPRNNADLHLWDTSTRNGAPEWAAEGWGPIIKGNCQLGQAPCLHLLHG